MKKAGDFAGLFRLRALCLLAFCSALAFIGRSSNKLHGTGETAEHRWSPLVVGRAVQSLRRNSNV
jgi:hypothetical protein